MKPFIFFSISILFSATKHKINKIKVNKQNSESNMLHALYSSNRDVKSNHIRALENGD